MAKQRKREITREETVALLASIVPQASSKAMDKRASDLTKYTTKLTKAGQKGDRAFAAASKKNAKTRAKVPVGLVGKNATPETLEYLAGTENTKADRLTVHSTFLVAGSMVLLRLSDVQVL